MNVMWSCCWRKPVSCEAWAVAVSIEDMEREGWRLVLCEDGEERPFCPEHAPMCVRPEEERQ